MAVLSRAACRQAKADRLLADFGRLVDYEGELGRAFRERLPELRETSLPTLEVALATGFASASQFSRA